MTLPSDAVREGTIWLARALVTAGLASSNAEARRSIAQGAVRIDGEQVTDPDVELSPEQLIGKVVQVGKRRFARIAGVV